MKRIVCIALVVCLVLQLIPAGAVFASNPPRQPLSRSGGVTMYVRTGLTVEIYLSTRITSQFPRVADTIDASYSIYSFLSNPITTTIAVRNALTNVGDIDLLGSMAKTMLIKFIVNTSTGSLRAIANADRGNGVILTFVGAGVNNAGAFRSQLDLPPGPNYRVITQNGALIRTGPHASDPDVYRLPYDTRVTVVGGRLNREGNYWWLLDNGHWIWSNHVEFVRNSASPPSGSGGAGDNRNNQGQSNDFVVPPTGQGAGQLNLGLVPASTVSLGTQASAAISADGFLYTWGGTNFSGQLGHGDTVRKQEPTRVERLSNVVAVSMSSSHSLALTANGAVYAWGSNSNGELGLGNSGSGTQRHEPTRIPGISNVIAIATSTSPNNGRSIAVTSDGYLYMWGSLVRHLGSTGRVSPHTRTAVTTPTRVPGITDVVAFGGGSGVYAIITSNGNLYTWGSNSSGNLGLGYTGNYHRMFNTEALASPRRVQGISNVVAISIGNGHSLALTAEGNLYSWGSNSHGQLGFGDTGHNVFRRYPQRIPSISNVMAISAGDRYSAAVTASGHLYTLGRNDSGKLGHGQSDSNIYLTTPTRVQGISNVVSVELGNDHSAVITANGNLYLWGNNTAGKLGLGDSGSNTNRNTPTRVRSGIRVPSR